PAPTAIRALAPAVILSTAAHPGLSGRCVFQWPSHHRQLHSFPTRRSSDLGQRGDARHLLDQVGAALHIGAPARDESLIAIQSETDRKSTRLNSSHVKISYAVFCLTKKIWSTTPYTSPRNVGT